MFTVENEKIQMSKGDDKNHHQFHYSQITAVKIINIVFTEDLLCITYLLKEWDHIAQILHPFMHSHML